MTELFVFGTMSFWVLVLAEIALLFIFSEAAENGIGATISLAVFVAALQFIGKVDLFGYVGSHPIHMAVALTAYFLLGTAWGIFKWRKYVLAKLEKYNEFFQRFLRDKALPPETTVLPVELRSEWKSRVDNTKNYGNDSSVADVPLVKENKSRILRWMSLWPFGLTWYVTHDFIVAIYQGIYKRIAAFLQQMANSIWAGASISENLNVPKTEDVEDHHTNIRGGRH
jgi:hypothetical protein